MGTWSVCVMGGDTPYDCAGCAGDILIKAGLLDKKFELMHMPDDWTKPQQAKVRKAIDAYGFTKLLRKMTGKDYHPYKKYNGDKNIYTQVLGLIAISCGAKLTDKDKAKIIKACREDELAAEDERRLEIMAALAKAVSEYKDKPTTLPQQGLFDRMAEVLGGGD